MNRAILTGAMLLLASTTFGAELSVPSQFSTIQAAIDAATAGDTVIIAPGLYEGTGNKDITFSGKPLTVRSVDPNNPWAVSSTIIDCDGLGRGFTLDANVVLEGLTITDGNIAWGAGILISSPWSPVIRNCVITNNSSLEYGGGIYSIGGPTIIGCMISDNYAMMNGGGIYCDSSTTTIIDCDISGNTAANRGGGIYALGTFVVDNCRIVNNLSAYGGGIWCYNTPGTPTINSSVIAGNIASGNPGGGAIFIENDTVNMNNSIVAGNSSQSNGGGLYISNQASIIAVGCTFAGNETSGTGGGVFMNSSSSSFSGTNSIFWGNIDAGGVGSSTAQIKPYYTTGWAGLLYSCIQDANANDANIPFGGQNNNNIDDDPMFVREPNGNDYGDLHLQADSPCIDAGSPLYKALNLTDIDGQPRVIGQAIDMGADEYEKMIIVTSPKENEVWATSSKRIIKWSSSGVGSVDILFSADAGANWETIVEGISDANSYLWEIPGDIDSSQCVISVLPGDGDPNVICRESGLFTVRWYPVQPPVPPEWQHRGLLPAPDLSDNRGPELGCVKWVYETDGPVSSQVAITWPYWNSYGVYIGSEDGVIYALDDEGQLVWSYDINTPIVGSPAVGYYWMVYVAGQDGKLYAIDDFADLRWTYDTGAPIYSTPVVGYDGKIYVCSQDGAIYAIGPDGSDLWTFSTKGPGNLKGAIFAAPVVDKNGTVYVAGFYDPNLYALDANTGGVKWVRNFEFATDPYDANIGQPFAPPALDANGVIYQTLVRDPNLYAIDPCTGNILWSARLRPKPNYYCGTPPYQCCEIIDEYLAAIRNHTSIHSETLWDYQNECNQGLWQGISAQGWMNSTNSSGWSSPAVGPDGTIYVGLDDPFLRAVSPTGQIKWITQLGMTGGFTISVADNGFIYAASDDGYVCVVDVNGFEVSRFKGIDWVSFPAIASDGTVIVSDSNNRVWAISDEDCPPQQADLHRPQDLSPSSTIDFIDLAAMANTWLDCTEPGYTPCNGALSSYGTYAPGDIDRDLYVDIRDLMMLTDKWLTDTESSQNWNYGEQFWPHPHTPIVP